MLLGLIGRLRLKMEMVLLEVRKAPLTARSGLD